MKGPAVAATATAPGKLLLVGEHAVVHGATAFAVPFPAVTIRAEILRETGPLRLESAPWSGELAPTTPAPADGLAAAALATLRELGVPAADLVIRLTGNMPAGAGLGSSAAAAAALVRALMLAHGHRPGAEVEGFVHLAETAAHGTPSGVDGRVVTMARPIAFRIGETVSPLVLTGAPFHLVVAHSGTPRDTRHAVAVVRAHLEAAPERTGQTIQRLGALAIDAADAWSRGDAARLGRALAEAHGLLAGLGVSTPMLDRLVEAANEAGALGAKLTGAGMGGVMVAVAPDAPGAGRIAQALSAAGATGVWTHAYQPENRQ